VIGCTATLVLQASRLVTTAVTTVHTYNLKIIAGEMPRHFCALYARDWAGDCVVVTTFLPGE
jgi:hypothetical protein